MKLPKYVYNIKCGDDGYRCILDLKFAVIYTFPNDPQMK